MGSIKEAAELTIWIKQRNAEKSWKDCRKIAAKKLGVDDMKLKIEMDSRYEQACRRNKR